MTPEHHERVGRLFRDALELPAGERSSFLSRSCDGDAALQSEVESLLSYEAVGRVAIDGSAMEAVGRTMAVEQSHSWVGRQVSHYCVLSRLGGGGMGEVYRARDTRLGRDVAIKALPLAFAADSARMRRFEEEARTIGQLNHPNIVVVHDIGVHDGAPFIVTEMLEGEDLRQRLNHGPLTLRRAVDYAQQIARGLAATHARGIVHRDLKPENLLVTREGCVKILDFGLAKLTDAIDGKPPVSAGRLETSPGFIVGTIGYLAPEQLRGECADHRADVFAFGVILHEMLSGRRPFERASPSEVVAAILKDEPPDLGGGTGLITLNRIVRRCLEKEPEQRFQSSRDLAFALDTLSPTSTESAGVHAPPFTLLRPAGNARYRFMASVESVEFTPAQGAPPPPAKSWRDARSFRRWLVAGCVLIGMSSLGLFWRQPPSTGAPDPAVLPTPLTTYHGTESAPTFSPDGSQIAFQWNGIAGENDDIYVISIGAAEPLRLTTSPQLDTRPAWSPDGRLIAFLRRASDTDEFDLLLVPPTGGREQKLTRIRSPVRMGRAEAAIAWAPDGLSLVVPHRASGEEPAGLVSFELSSGGRRRLTQPAGGGRGDMHPAYSPDGSTVAFVRQTSCCVYQVMLIPKTGGEVRELARRSFVGATRMGLAWRPDGSELLWPFGLQLWRVPLDGRPMAQIVEAGRGVGDVAVARHGQRLAYAHETLDKDVWSVDLASSEPEPRRHISSTMLEGNAQFSPDGEKIAFASNRSGTFEIWIADANGANPLRLTSTGAAGSPRWSPDGEWIAFDSTASGNPEIYVIGASGGPPRRMTAHPAEDSIPVWSPDGRWIYFTSNRTGTHQIWRIEAHSEGEPPVEAAQITRTGGQGASVSADGKYLYYVKSTGGDGRSLCRMHLAGGSETSVVPAFKAIWMGYSLSNNRLYYLDTEKDAASGGATWKVRWLDPDTGDAHAGDVSLPWAPDSVAASPDGRTLLFTVTENRGSDLMVLDLSGSP